MFYFNYYFIMRARTARDTRMPKFIVHVPLDMRHLSSENW